MAPNARSGAPLPGRRRHGPRSSRGACGMSDHEILKAAILVAQKGRPVFPCDPRTKRPRTPRGFKDATTDPLVIRAWFEPDHDSMLGMPTGSTSGLVVLDVD